MKLEEIIEELEKYKSYQTKYECAMEDKKELAKYVYENELKKYEEESYTERCKRYIKERCKHCRFLTYCNVKLPDDILKPVENEGWFPGYKTCGEFKWS